MNSKINVEKKSEVNEKRVKLEQFYHPDNYERVAERELDLEAKLYLSVILRGALSGGLSIIKPLESIDQKLTPTTDFTVEMVKSLTTRKIIVPHSSSSLMAFSDGDDFPKQYEIFKVYYWLNIKPSDGAYEEMIRRLMYPHTENLVGVEDFCYDMWKKIATHELFEYIQYQLKKIDFPSIYPNKKTATVFEQLLDYFSMAEICYVIDQGINHVSRLFLEGKLVNLMAANEVINFCESYAEMAIAKNWKLKKFRRDEHLTPSLISKVFFTTMLGDPNIGFYESPGNSLTHIF
ncbi:hypothetical protein [Ornithinibacillus halotolerans]|uniref:Uncharacterized protein n=1 Tax=Ornithinibacillus halotolerans TaxID=1274357 RepID=A0A916RUM9_9BACI|nr:hypothetical protein [Ornithinibacillus halotolerans]GGA71163.1 hypothetical protein GCM10008025_13820 [Ornithinibacillus halotolerans]